MTKVIICSVQEYGEHEEVEGEKTLHLCNLSILYPAVSPNSLLPFCTYPYPSQASLVAQRVKHLPAVWETRVQSLGQEDPLEKEMATQSSNLAWKIPWTEKRGRLLSMGSQRVGHS